MKTIIQDFIDAPELAIIGVSRNKEKWGNFLFRKLKEKGYMVYPVNPNAEVIEGERCYPTIKEVPSSVKSVVFTVPSALTAGLVRECKEAGIQRVWMHHGAGETGSQSPEAISYCKENNIDLVYDFCPMMFFPGAGIHKVHFIFKKLFGKLPPDYKE